jgi:hypothetical protein
LLRLVYAGRLQPIEEALASLGGQTAGASPAPGASVKKAPPVTAPPPASSAPGGDIRSRIQRALLEARQTHTADAVGHSEVVESAAEVVFITPQMYQPYLRGAEFEAAVKRVVGSAVKITVRVGEGVAGQASPQPAATAPAQDEISARALAHPEVQKFQELFPGSQVRKIRDLRENEA